MKSGVPELGDSVVLKIGRSLKEGKVIEVAIGKDMNVQLMKIEYDGLFGKKTEWVGASSYDVAYRI
jgi:hypothetical protein